MRLLSKPAIGGETGVVGSWWSDRSSRTPARCSGVTSNQPSSGRSRGIKFACVCPSVSGRHRQNGEASGRVPEVLHAAFEHYDADEHPLPDALDDAGYALSDIDAVVASHLHLDHAGGLHHFDEWTSRSTSTRRN